MSNWNLYAAAQVASVTCREEKLSFKRGPVSSFCSLEPAFNLDDIHRLLQSFVEVLKWSLAGFSVFDAQSQLVLSDLYNMAGHVLQTPKSEASLNSGTSL